MTAGTQVNSLPMMSCCLPIRTQAKVASLQQVADSMFPEGAGKPKAIAKVGSAAELNNELAVNAKEALDEL